jgi:UDP-2,3-diacylglucosamine hydrolase
MQIPPQQKIYFLSDFHLGAPNHAASLEREKRIVAFLEQAKKDAAQIFIVGDMFDFWYEYKTVVPKGFVRILGKLAELTDRGIPIHFFVGNHDMWMKGYFEKELNITVYFEPKSFTFNQQQFLIGHGDGLGPGDKGYKLLKKIFRNKICQFAFGILPPAVGVGLANFLSQRSRIAAEQTAATFLGEENEWLITYCKEVLANTHYHYFIFGHRHLPISFSLNTNSQYINLGDWIRYNSYAVFNGHTLTLQYYNS